MVNNIFTFKKKFLKFDNVKDFHYALTNIRLLGKRMQRKLVLLLQL